MRDLSETFFDGGSLTRPDSAAIAIPNEGDASPRFADDLVTFHPDCFTADGQFRPEVKAWMLALATDGDLPCGGMA